MCGFAVLMESAAIYRTVAAMNMSIEMVCRFVRVHQIAEGFKTFVENIGTIVQPERRSVGHQQIDAAGAADHGFMGKDLETTAIPIAKALLMQIL